MKKLLYVCEVDSGGITEYSILQCEALVKAGVSVFFLCKSSFPNDRFSKAINIIEFEPVEPPLWAFGKVKTLWRMTVGLNRFSQQIQRIAEAEGCESILFSFFKEYFAPFWVGPLRKLARRGVVIGTIAHDPVRDFVVGPLWWHRWSVRLGYSFARHVFVHDDTPVDFAGKRPEGIEVHRIPHGPYEVAESKIGRLEIRRRLGFLTTDGSDIHRYSQKAQGHAQVTLAGASEPNSLASELADAPVSESLARFASGPAGARIAPGGIGSVGGNQLADSEEVLEGQSQARLQMDSQKLRSIRTANYPSASGGNSSSAPIREIRGSNSEALDTSAPADVVFLAFGQIRDGKNLDLFLQAMTRLPANVKLLVAGKGDSGSSRPPEFYQKLAEELGVAARCRWDIRRIPDEEVGDFFAACDVVLVTYSAKFRSASGVLNAAVSARKPVLASSGSGPLKTVVEKYRLGVFVKPDDLDEILRGAQMILDFFSQPATRYQQLATASLLNPAWARYVEENSWSLNAKSITEAFFGR